MPNMIGSLTFIIVALRCSENSTPRAFASAICASTKAASFRVQRRGVQHLAGLHLHRRAQRKLLPVALVNSIRTRARGRHHDRLFAAVEIAFVHVRDVRFRIRFPRAHAVRVLRAYAFTAFGARRSELPSRSTGFTALPLTLS